MKETERGAEQYKIYIPLRVNHRYFGGKLPIFGDTSTFWVEEGSLCMFFPVFCRYLSHLTCGRVHFCCIEIRTNSRSGQYGLKIILSLQFWSAPNLLPLRFFNLFTDSDSPFAIYY